MIRVKTSKEIQVLREGGNRLGSVLKRLTLDATEGMTSAALEERALFYIKEMGDVPAFLGYRPEGASRPYPAGLCVSINNEIVHGIPTENVKTLKKGDLISLDLGLIHEGLVTDSAVTISVGSTDQKGKKLLRVGREALQRGIAEAKEGNHVGDIGNAIETYVKKQNLSVFRELVGHGVGYDVHEEPLIPNFGRKGEGPKLLSGMVIAIEPMIGEGSSAIRLLGDGFTYVTKDGSRAVHFEHTVLITRKGPEILTSHEIGGLSS